MNTIDIILLICFIPAVIRGISKGFIEQAVALISLVASIWIAYHFSDILGIWLAPYLQVSEPVLKIISFALLVIVVVLVLYLVGKLLSKLVKTVMLGWLDKLFGITFAMFLTCIILGLLIIVFESINATMCLVPEETIASSILYAPIRDFTYAIFPFFRQWLGSF